MSDYIGRHDHERGAPITADCDSWCAWKADRYAEQQKPAMPSNPPSARMTEQERSNGDTPPDPNCWKCKGTCEAENAQFSCWCRWRPAGMTAAEYYRSLR